MKSLKVNVTPFDNYIPSHFIELNFNEEQINLIESAATAMRKLEKELNYSFPNKGYVLHGVEIIMPVAKWKNEELSYKMTTTVVNINSRTLYISGHTEELNVLIESEEIYLSELGILKDANAGHIF